MNTPQRLAAPAILLLAVSAASPVQAIECQGGYQIVRGQPISTPYCRDSQLAAVARSYGLRVSKSDMDNVHRKKEVCRLVGRDIRVAQACQDVNGSGRRF